MDRDTKDITIGKHSFKVKTYATAREVHEIQQAYFAGAKVEVVGTEPKFSEINPSVLFDVKKATIAAMVVELDGSKDNIVDRCIELPNEDFEDLASQLDALVSKKELEASADHYSMGRMDEAMQMVAIMQEFHWTYDEFMSTPAWIIKLILEKFKRDQKARELATKKHGK